MLRNCYTILEQASVAISKTEVLDQAQAESLDRGDMDGLV